MSTPDAGPYGALKCGCTVTRDWNCLGIEYCSTHAAAPALLEACRDALRIEGAANQVGSADAEGRPSRQCQAAVDAITARILAALKIAKVKP